jgi:phosphoribosylformylglycinamidine synthase
MHGAVAADIPVGPLVTEAPLYYRPVQPLAKPADIDAAALPARQPFDCLKKLLACPDLASKRWIWERYDHLVMGNTVERPGGDAAVVRVNDAGKALALVTDCTPRYVRADPELGGMQAVAESWRNLCAVGAIPLAVTDNMNFGNPEKPEIMAEFAGAIAGMRAACLALAYPVVSGNVSLYNETSGNAIWPAPVIGGVGLIADAATAVDLALKRDGHALILVGETTGHLGASLYLREIEGREDGAPPRVDLAAERRHGEFVRGQIATGRVAACHDISDGGLLVAVAEMTMAGGKGVALADLPSTNAGLFGEDQGRYLIETDTPEALLAAGRNAGIYAQRIGTVGGAALTLPGGDAISVSELTAVNEAWLPAYMAGYERRGHGDGDGRGDD